MSLFILKEKKGIVKFLRNLQNRSLDYEWVANLSPFFKKRLPTTLSSFPITSTKPLFTGKGFPSSLPSYCIYCTPAHLHVDRLRVWSPDDAIDDTSASVFYHDVNACQFRFPTPFKFLICVFPSFEQTFFLEFNLIGLQCLKQESLSAFQKRGGQIRTFVPESVN
uniref:Uncharacterized protein n=1 Tax=Lactuca sativa TaxID=4236 RepID=A0A9R1XMW0_LACSA|nr:hypothetical protein LSAT_V11C300147780 [Lactuca sativa]